jgi:hypothetical protein
LPAFYGVLGAALPAVSVFVVDTGSAVATAPHDRRKILIFPTAESSVILQGFGMADRFNDEVVEAARKAKMLGVRAGSEHRYTGVWVVVVDNRIFARSWNDKPTGWFRAFKKQPKGMIQIGEREISVRAQVPRSARIRDAVTAAFGKKYNTKGSQKWVDGFADPKRLATTIEFLPR